MPAETVTPTRRTAYVLKVYPRFSETFVVTEILAREAAGEELAIYALRPTSDARFHPQLAQVRAPVTHLPRPHKLATEWDVLARAQAELPGFGERFGALMPLLVRLDPSVVAQGVDLALRLRADGITHVHVHFASMASWATAIASALTGIPYTVTTHAKDLFHDSVDRVVLGEVLHRAERVVAISDFNRRFLLDIDPALADKVVLVRNGLELGRFRYRDPQEPQGPLRVLAVGRLVEKKGFGHLVEAARLLAGKGEGATGPERLPLDVRIVGDGELKADLTAQVEAAGLGETVQLLGPRSQAELVEELAAADVLVAPCVVGADGNADGLPTVLLEAMASGVPCIASDVTGIPEAVHPAGEQGPATGILLGADPSDLAERLAAALAEVADPSWPRVEVARAARALVEREFDTARQSRRLAALEGMPRAGEGADDAVEGVFADGGDGAAAEPTGAVPTLAGAR
ncbi:glycosyltransferase [Ornithinimicrobium kibberense]|uniref:Glycosyltransferase n=2 Tax=Ornithinimicrobium kibberense TaxID=282060 RepID=A0ABV5V0V4_9MICO|nr:glycosyltransferase [Ornithinimicrobium kibberense]